MTVSGIDTPALVIDLDIMERNLRRMSEYARLHNRKLRPHTKTHKMPRLGREQLDLGAAGITVAKVGEPEVMSAAQPPNLLVEYPIVGQTKIERLSQVARPTHVTVAADSPEAAGQLSSARMTSVCSRRWTLVCAALACGRGNRCGICSGASPGCHISISRASRSSRAICFQLMTRE